MSELAERNLGKVIDDVLEIAPDLNDVFSSLIESVRYSSPEMMRARWDEAARILNRHAEDHEKGDEIANIFSGAGE